MQNNTCLSVFLIEFMHHHYKLFLSNLLGFRKALYIMVSDRRWAHKIYSETTSYCFNLKFCQTNKTFRYCLPNANFCSKERETIRYKCRYFCVTKSMLLERNVFPNKSDFNSSEKVWVDFKELNSFLLGLRFPPSALWVKGGIEGIWNV